MLRLGSSFPAFLTKSGASLRMPIFDDRIAKQPQGSGFLVKT